MTSDVFAQLSPPYSTIVVDPPWPMFRPTAKAPRYIDERGRIMSSGIHANPSDHPSYQVMTLDEIKALPISDLAADSRLFMWIPQQLLRHGWSVIETWGFEAQTTVLVWCKRPRATMRVTTEFVLIGKRGHPPRMPWTGTTWYPWPLQPVHSQKPAAFMDLVESWCPGPYVELFARQPRLGWDSWGHGYEAATA